MAAQIGSLYVSLTADVSPFVSGMGRAQSVTSSATTNIVRSAGVAERTVQSFWGAASGNGFRPAALIAVSRAFDNAADRANLLRGALVATTAVFGGFAAALSSNLILRYADSYVKLNNQVRVVSDGSADAAARFTDIQRTANASRSSLEATAILYSRLQKSAPDQAATKVLQYVETIQKALTLGGASAQEARSAAIQFSQAIASNRLGGEEMRAILETPLGLELARGLGVTIGKMREMGTAGELTAERVLGALDKIRGSINQQFSQSVLTTDQAITILDNKLTDYIGKVNETYGVTRILANGILGLGNNLETILPIVTGVAGGLAAAFVGRGLARAGGGLINTLKNDAAEARERVRLLQEQVGSLKTSLVDANLQRTNTAKAVALANTDAFADGSAVKSMQRAEQQVISLRQKTLDAFTAMKDAQAALKGIVAEVSPRAVAMADSLTRAESRLADHLQRQIDLRKEIRSAIAAETGALGLQATTGRLQAATEATRARVKLERESITVEKQIAKERETIAERQQRLAALTDAAEQRAAQRTIEAQRRVNEAKATFQSRKLDFGVAGLDLLDAERAVAASGDRNARQALAQQTADVRALQAALGPLNAQMVAASTAATQWGVAKAFVGRQVSSLIGLFGGPWGVAITGAIIGLGVFAAKSAEAAQKVANAERLIEEALQRRNNALGRQGQQAKDTTMEDLIKRTKDARKEVRDYLKDANTAVEQAVPTNRNNTNRASADLLTSIKQQAVDLATELKDGKISIVEFDDRLAALTKRYPVLTQLGEGFRDNAIKASRAAQAVQEYESKITQLEAGRRNDRDDPFFVPKEPEKEQITQFNDQRRELVQIQELMALRGAAFEVETKYQQLKAKYPAISDAELRASAENIVQLNLLKTAHEDETKAILDDIEAMQKDVAQRTAATVAYKEQQSAELSVLRLLAQGRDFDARVLEKHLAAKKAGAEVTKEAVRANEAERVSLELVTTARKNYLQAKFQEVEDEQKDSQRREQIGRDYRQEALVYVNAINLRVRGREVEARAEEEFFRLTKQRANITYEEVLATERAKTAADARYDSYMKLGRGAETLAQRLARLREESKGAFLQSDIDRDVLQMARGLRVAAADMEAYARAAASGDFSKAPKALMDLRDQRLFQEAAEGARQIVREYGTWEQIAGLAAEKQRMLDIAVANGAITAYQAKLAYADYLSGFQNYAWINKTADAFGQFVNSALDGTDLLAGNFENLEKAVGDLQKALQRLLIEEMVTTPLKGLIKGGLSGAAGGGGIGGVLSSLLGGGGAGGGTGYAVNPWSSGGLFGAGGTGWTMDSGGIAGVVGFGPKTKVGPLSIADSGLGPSHFLSVLEKGEAVLTKNLTQRTQSTMAGLAALPAGGGSTEVHIHNAPPGTTAKTKRSPDGRIDITLIRQMDDVMSGLVASGDSKTGKAMQGRFGLDPTRGMAG